MSEERVLSPRLRQVLWFLAQGYELDMIAVALMIQRNTVKEHVARLYRHYTAKNRAHLVALAYEHGDLEHGMVVTLNE